MDLIELNNDTNIDNAIIVGENINNNIIASTNINNAIIIGTNVDNDIITDTIDPIGENIDIKLNIITKYSKNHVLGSCLIDEIINFGWSRWGYNRPPDLTRVNEIIKYIEANNSIDWVLYFAYSNNNIPKLEIYDGLHRMAAITEYIKRYELINARCPLRDQIILISIKINPTPGDIVDAFTFINKSVPVPELYFGHIRKDIIEEIVEQWRDRYKLHFKPSMRTNIPNINRDIFIDIVSKIYEYYKINEDKAKLENILINTNNYIKNLSSFPNPVSVKALEKCKKTGCFMFIIKPTELFDYIVYHNFIKL